MSDEDRIELMILVKEGKITMEEAVERVSLWKSHAVRNRSKLLKHEMGN